MEARNYHAQERLKNGMLVTIRAIRPDDRDAFQEAYGKLDENTIFLRFFGPKPELSPQELTAATDVDFVRTVALVACLQDDEGEKIIGGGRYFSFGNADPPDMAEVAFAVEEDYHGLGLASKMLRHLTEIARQKGISQFFAEVLPENKGMLKVFSRSGLPYKQDYSEGVMHVTLSLAG